VVVSHALLRGCIVALCVTYGSGDLFAWARSEEVGSSEQVDHFIVDDEPSAYALLWSYFSSFVAPDSGAKVRRPVDSVVERTREVEVFREQRCARLPEPS
jgi:hypothetical protein